jgi:hypothetical protein
MIKQIGNVGDYGLNIGGGSGLLAYGSKMNPWATGLLTVDAMIESHFLANWATELQNTWNFVDHSGQGLIEITTITYSLSSETLRNDVTTEYYAPNGGLIQRVTPNGQ